MASQPKPPNPYQQAAAQQAAESGAAQSSAIINNPNIQNPFGSQSYDIAGWETVYDAQGKPQRVPRYTQTTTLSPDQMKLLGLQTQMQGNLGKIGVEQSARVGQALGQPFGTQGLRGASGPWREFNRETQQFGLATTGGVVSDTGIAGDIAWNFEKFLINRQGVVIRRFAPDIKPEDIGNAAPRAICVAAAAFALGPVIAMLGALRSFLMLALSDDTISLQVVLSWVLGSNAPASWRRASGLRC